VKHTSGLTVSEIAEALGITFAEVDADRKSAQEYDSLSHVVMRMVRNGYLSRDDQYPAHYTLVKEPPVPQSVLPPEKRRKKRTYIRDAEQAARFREYMKARKAQFKAERRCVDCGSGLEEGREHVKCPECHDRNLEASKQYRKTKRGRTLDRVLKKRAYWSDVEKARAERKERYMRKKLSGVCQSCNEPAEEDSQYCATHREAANESCREYRRRVRAA
jgi:hypothetical protein